MSQAATTVTPPAPRRSAAKAESLTVRMYRGILGDCFLLTHRRGRGVYRALIDCGVLQCIGLAKPNTFKGPQHIPEIVDDILTSVTGEHGKPVLDLIVATHQHFDHLSGFMLATNKWAQVEIKQVWMAWTEDPQDEDAKAWDDKKKKARAALDAVAAMSGFSNTEAIKTVKELQQFDPVLKPEAGRLASCARALDFLKTRAKESGGGVRYLQPKEVVSFGLDSRLTAYVLGPPRDLKRLKQLDPKGESNADREVYLTALQDIDALQSTLAIASASTPPTASGDMDGPDPKAMPFPRRFWGPLQLTKDGRQLARPAALDYPTRELYWDAKADHRRIDAEWLGSAEALAMKVDGDVNNTSLALAIEIAGGDVLLFPADAQVGNWLSWGEGGTYPPTTDPTAPPGKTIDDILARVVFYKVGHHGSHNATMRKEGLEKVTHPDLTAMIPVVTEVAHEQKSKNNPQGWDMPYNKLFLRLVEKTGGAIDDGVVKTDGRIVKGDGDPKREATAFAGSKAELGYGPDELAPLWVELTFQAKPDAPVAGRIA